MAIRRRMNSEEFIQQLKRFEQFGMMSMPVDDALAIIRDDSILELEESQFQDPGEDWTALYVDHKQVGYWRGF